jgi:uncharacterized membrane protein YcaP (DUF421 family)
MTVKESDNILQLMVVALAGVATMGSLVFNIYMSNSDKVFKCFYILFIVLISYIVYLHIKMNSIEK